MQFIQITLHSLTKFPTGVLEWVTCYECSDNVVNCMFTAGSLNVKNEALLSVPPGENTPAYYYGTHYSSAMIVASYMIRIEPFTQHFLKLQVWWSVCVCVCV